MTEEAVPLEEAVEEYRSNDFFIKYGLLQLLVRSQFLDGIKLIMCTIFMVSVRGFALIYAEGN